jgi:hypothetical protein
MDIVMFKSIREAIHAAFLIESPIPGSEGFLHARTRTRLGDRSRLQSMKSAIFIVSVLLLTGGACLAMVMAFEQTMSRDMAQVDVRMSRASILRHQAGDVRLNRFAQEIVSSPRHRSSREERIYSPQIHFTDCE